MNRLNRSLRRDNKPSDITMVTSIGLPPLIVNGRFQSLSSMSVEDLETFIPYMVKCSINSARDKLVNGIPEWWSSVVPYQFPLQKPIGLSQIGYLRHLSSIVYSCYWYHNAQYLLSFSEKVSENPESVCIRKNEDNTTSIFYVQNTVLISKFSSENNNNDSQPKKKEKALRRCLLPSLPKKTIPIPDIYLCEHCDAEFSSHVEMQKHEKVCYEIVIDDDDEDDDGDDNDNNDDNNADDNDNDNDNEAKEQSEKDNYIDNFSDSSEEIEILEHIKPNVVQTTQKNNLMSYLGLEQVINQNKSSMKKLKGHCSESPCKRWVNVDKCLHKNRNVEFSSSFGRKMLEHCVKRDLINKIEKNISLYESYCGTTITTNRELRELSDFKVSYRRGKKTDWDHCYSFGKSQRIKRYYTLKTGLDERSRRLLKQCKELRIVLNRIKLPS